MESHLHTLHVEKCNNEREIIKKEAKAVCWELYKSRLELKCKQMIMENTVVLKAASRGVDAAGTWLHREQEALATSLAGAASLSFLSCIHVRSERAIPHLHSLLPEVKRVQTLHYNC